MICNRCGEEIEPGEEREHMGQVICEDCYMDILSPVRACDPWATHSAKNLQQNSDESEWITPLQSQIIGILKKTGGADSETLMEELDDELTLNELEREIATLHHMEKVGGKRKNGRIIWCLWKTS